MNSGSAIGAGWPGDRHGKGKTPNILLFIMDDVGVVHGLRDHETELTDACKARLHDFWARLL